MVSNDDIDRLNHEVDRFVGQLKISDAGLPLIKALESSRISTIATAPRKSRTILFYIVMIFLFGWIGLLFGWVREQNNSRRRKDCLGHFAQDMLALASDEP